MKIIIIILACLFFNTTQAQIDFSRQITGNKVFFQVTSKGQYYEAYKWEFGDGSYVMEIGRDTISHYYDSLKNYNVCVYGIPMPGSTFDSICKIVNITTNALVETSELERSFYYNPEKQIISFYEQPLINKLQIFDIQGRNYYTIHNTKSISVLNISDWPDGLYVINIECNGKYKRWKILKE